MPDSIDEHLRRFVGPGSMKFFNITYLNTSFLHEPVVSLERNSHFHEARRTVVNLAVTSDAAKREVKLCADFKESVRKEDSNFQTVFADSGERESQATQHPKHESTAYQLVSSN